MAIIEIVLKYEKIKKIKLKLASLEKQKERDDSKRAAKTITSNK